MKHSVLFTLIMLLACLCHAQDELPTLSADRPGYTWGAEVLPLHKISWENGFGFESGADGSRTFTLNSTIVRYGIFQNVELRVGTDLLLLNDGQAMESSFAMSPLTIGTKLKVFESSNWLPSIGLLAEFKSPHVGSKELLPSHLAPSMYLMFEHEINDRLWLCYDTSVEWDGETAVPQTFLSLAIGFNITDDIGAFVETYNYLHPEQENQYMTEFGFTWMPSRRVQLDIECDLDFQDFGRYYALGCGVAWMIN
ncbi:MAG: transporter [Bacteroidales bacterium]|nr:transporter [Bacteroidales bacterium]